jgi:hypothetical protein
MLKASLESIKIVYLARTISQFKLYFANNPLKPSVPNQEATINNEQQPSPRNDKQASPLQLDITLLNPIIIIPDHYSSPDKAIGNVGRVHISNDPSSLSILLSALHLSSMQSGHVSNLLDSDLDLIIRYGDPDVVVDIRAPDVAATLSHSQYQQIFEIIYKNIYSVKNPPSPAVDRTHLTGIGLQVIVTVPHANVTLVRSDSQYNALARLVVTDLVVTYTSYRTCKFKIYNSNR